MNLSTHNYTCGYYALSQFHYIQSYYAIYNS